jgi:hypothetical protein
MKFGLAACKFVNVLAKGARILGYPIPAVKGKYVKKVNHSCFNGMNLPKIPIPINKHRW